MNTRPHLFVADVGTSSLKSGIVDRTGNLLWYHRQPMLFTEGDLSHWKAEYWLNALQESTQRLPNEPIDGIVFSGNGPTLVPLDSSGKTIGSVLLWIDGNAHRKTTSPSFFLPKIAWLRDTHPEIYHRSKKFVSCPEYLSFVLTGNLVSITPQEEFNPYLWDEVQLSSYGIDAKVLPDFIYPGSKIGQVSHEASEQFGFKEGTPVFAGGTDFMMSLVGTGSIQPGITCDRAGTSEGINYCSQTAIQDQRVRTLPHAVSGLYNVAGILSSTGRMFEWFRRFSGQSGRDYEAMIQDIEQVTDWDDLPLFYPSTHSGERFEFNRALFSNLRPNHGSAEMGRAIVEAIGFTIRQVVQILDSVECPVTSLRVCGGQAKNLRWNQMKANMINKSIEIPKIQDAELLGCAIEGFRGLGEFDSYQSACSELVKIEYHIHPQDLWVERYENRFIVYENGYSNLVGLNE